ncbi:hypothetical protein F511_21928 [Dorcoceras hygrometricum]|uniref:Transposase (Putative), gypsy type n=1 Tax=Dorcoceras hygrometricum TaxID=472368 RepID=A0A2Z7CVZ3_9LAMI|nr:hypothetical protein F511_21928 [Dorcoceras hygrometricum]
MPPIPSIEECPDPTPVVNIPEVSSPERGSMKESGPGRVPPLNYFEDSLVVSSTAPWRPSTFATWPPTETWVVAWGGEVIKHLTRAQREASDTHEHFIEAMGHHAELVAWVEELKAIRVQEKKMVEAVQEALRAQLVTERASRTTEDEAMRAELEAALDEKTVVEAQLKETKVRVEEEIGRLKSEATNAWDIGKEEFLKSPDSNACVQRSPWLISKRASMAPWLSFEPKATPRRTTRLPSSTAPLLCPNSVSLPNYLSVLPTSHSVSFNYPYTMSSPSDTPVSSAAASIDSTSPVRQVGEPWLPRSEELPNTLWYEEKSSTLRLSDIDTIKEKGGTMGKFEVVNPQPDERAHRPPPEFHNFYMNQIEMGLRIPISRFIAAFFCHIQLSPSQLASNSYSLLLALAVLLSYHEIPLIPYVLMQLVQIKRLGPGKFYLSHKGDHSFIKGNPSSHKGWMSRFFYIKCDVMRDPWRCEMHWRDSAITIVPRTPDRTPSLTPFLEAMCDKSYNAPELIKEDLLCFFKFSRKGVKLVGDLDERMGKAEMLKAMQEEARASGEVGPPKKTTKKRKVSSSAEKKVQAERRKKSVSTSGTRPEETQERVRAPTPPTATPEETLDPTKYIFNMAPESDVPELMKADDVEVIAYFSSHIAPAIVWGGEMVRRLTQSSQKVRSINRSLDKASHQHTKVMAKLEELEACRARELEEAKTQQELLEAELLAEKEARVAEKEAMRVELEEARARSEQEAERLKGEAREEFLKSPEFDVLLGNRAFGYFKDGFWGCLAQFRAHGYSEEEHPASFLDLQQALAEVGDEEEEAEEEEPEEQEEGEIGGDAGTTLLRHSFP